MGRARKPLRLNLALPGGGTHGAFTWGVLDALIEDGRFEFDTITAVGSGAINATLLAFAWPRGRDAARTALSDFWREVGNTSPAAPVFGPSLLHAPHFAQVLSPFGALAGDPYAVLRDLLNARVDFSVLSDSPIHVCAIATNIDSGRLHVFSNRSSMLTPDILLASNATPFGAAPYMIDGEYYWGDGLGGDPPLFPAIYESSVPDILLLHLRQIRHEFPPNSAPEIVERITDMTLANALASELQSIAAVHPLIANKSLAPHRSKKVHLHMIDGAQAIASAGGASHSSRHYAASAFLSTLFEQGRTAALDWAKHNASEVGRSSTFDARSYLPYSRKTQ